MRRLLILGLLLFMPWGGRGQNTHEMTNMARDFWVMFLPNTGGNHQTDEDECSLIVTGPDDALVTVVSTLDSVTIPFTGGTHVNHLCGTNAAVRGRAFHVSATADIALFARNAIQGSHDVAMVVPTLCLGTKYIVQSAAAAAGDTEMLGIVATEDSTVVTVHLVNPNGVPIPPDDIDVPADGLLHIPLQRGEAYIVGTQQHRTYGAFSGMDVTSNGRPFALFQGNSAAHVPVGDNYSGGHLYEQAVPYSQWGHVHLTGGIGEPDRCYFLMTSADNDNRCYFNTQTPQPGETMSLNRGQSSNYVQETHHYAAVSTYTTGRMGYTMRLASYGTSGYLGGPSTVMLPSIEHGVQEAWFTVHQFDPYQENHLIIFCDTALIHGLRLDGMPVSDSSWLSYLQVQPYRTTVGIGQHHLAIDSGTFVAFVYGLRDGLNDSYANPVGMALDPYPRDTLVLVDTTCQYEAYHWGPFQWADGALTDSGTFYMERTLFDPDSIHLYRLTLTVLPAYRSVEYHTLVPGDSLVVEDTVLTIAGTYTFHHSTANGCDSAHTVVLDFCTAPVPCVEVSRPFVDFDHPTVELTDCTAGQHSTLWQFDDGLVSQSTRVQRHLHHPLPDSLGIRLRVCDSVGCCADTLFALPTLIHSAWFPNVFTPDQPENNRFGCITSVEADVYHLDIYDRHGLLVFSTDRVNDRWDGSHNGRPCPQGAYVYHWYLSDAYGFRQHGTGTITLVR